MDEPYAIRDVSTWVATHAETVGTKKKVWLREPDGGRWLFKYRKRQDIGDDWAEKIAGEFAEALGMPHPVVELAERGGQPGVISLDFTDDTKRGDLVLGNVLLVRADQSYPNEERSFRLAAHRVERVLDTLAQSSVATPAYWRGASEIRNGIDLFIGYLLLDALICNQDRHHQNWGVLERRSEDALSLELAPTFDHASSLAFNLTDGEPQRRLGTKDPAYSVDAYVRRGESKFFDNEASARGLSQLDAFERATKASPDAGRAWLSSLDQVGLARLREAIDRAPSARMTDTSKQFSRRMIECQFASLLALRDR